MKTTAADREQQLNAILQTIADAILIVNDEGRVCYANKASEQIFGRPISQVVGEGFGLPILTGETTEVDIVQPRGGAIIAEMRTAETTWDGEPAIIASIRDITARKRATEDAQELLRQQLARAQAEENEKQARFLVEAANVLSASLDYSISLKKLAAVCTAYYADWCVIDIVEANGELMRAAVAHNDLGNASVAQALAAVSPESRPLPNEPEVLRRGEALVIDDADWGVHDAQYQDIIRAIDPQCAMMVPLVSRGNTLGVVAFISSGSRPRYRSEELTVATELGRYAATAIDNSRLIREAQRGNESKTNFLAVMSHELRTPLNAIMGYADLLHIGVPADIPVERKSYLDGIQTSAEHLVALIDEILMFARLESGGEKVVLAPVGVGQIAENVAAIIDPLARAKDLRFTVRLPPDFTIQTEAAKVEQILENLLSNAVKFTSSGSIDFDISRFDDWTHFVVTDSGIGIAAEHVERIFEPFWQVEQTLTRRANGTGLGLSVARRLARELGGNLVVRTKVGIGSTFTLQLPNEGPPARAT